MRISRHVFGTGTVVAVGGALLAASAISALAIGAPTTPAPVPAYALAARNAAALVASRPAFLHASPNDAFVQGSVVSSGGIFYVPYERTYALLPVVGGDFVVVIDGAGQIIYNSVAQDHPNDIPSIRPTLSQAAAEAIATRQLRSVTRIEGTQLVVNALGATARLAWESTIDGFGADGISRLTVDVDALNGTVLRQQEHVLHGTGTAAWNGPNPVALGTTHPGSTFLMSDPTITNLSCQDASNNTIFSGPDDAWGNGNATSRETGCVDALFGAQSEARMLSQWLGRNAMDGAGGAWPIRVGLNDENAFYDGTQVQIGHNSSNQWIGSLDVIAHEMGHGIDDHTPGGISANGTQEFIADTFGAATEWFANEPSPFDVPDFTVGEQINLVGNGPIRNMFNPSALGDPNCYSSSIPSTEVHAAAGPGNHWFYLLAEGSQPTNGQPTSSTCNGSTVVGLGVQSAIKILYNAMLMKTTGSSYLKYRTWTLQAAKNLFAGSCGQFNTVKAAWDAVNVPAQPGEPTCVLVSPRLPPWAAVNAVSRSTDKLDIFVTDQNGVIYTAAWQPAFTDWWHGWWQLNGGRAQPGSPVYAVSRSQDKLDAFVIGTDSRVYTAAWEPAFTDGWHGWWQLNGGVAALGAHVTVVSRGPDKLDAFMVGTDGHVYTANWQPAYTDWWHGWYRIGDITVPQGAAIHGVSRSVDKIDIFATDVNGVIWTAAWDTAGWHGWWQLNGGMAAPGAPVFAVSRSTDKLDVFVVGTDGHAWTAAWEPDFTDWWHGWWSIGTDVFPQGASLHGVSRSTDKLDVFGTDTAGRIVTASWQPSTGWLGWGQINGGGTQPGAPVTAVSRSTDKLDIFVVGGDNRVWTAAWTPNSGGWMGWWAIGQ
jgi:Zn-dependent metalloprotease